MGNRDNSKRVLIAMDVSNFEYMVMWGAFNRWRKDFPDEALVVKPAIETDQDNLPNLLVYDSFRRILANITQSKLEAIIWIAKNNHQNELDIADGIDVVFTEDDRLENNFRRKLYPEYKAHRKLHNKMYDVFSIKNYIQNVIFKELEIERKYGYRIIKVEDCESDDIMAVLMKNTKDYLCRILISSDKDFLQLTGVYQYDLLGNKVIRSIKNHEEMALDEREYLLWKILRGDVSDNIKNVFPKYGDVKSYRLVKDVELLKKMLNENQEAFERYQLNKKLIDFRQMPSEIEEKIYKTIVEKMNKSTEKDEMEEYFESKCIELN